MGTGWSCLDLLVPNLASWLFFCPLCPIFEATQVCIWWPSLPSPDRRGQDSASGEGEGWAGAERQELSEFYFSLHSLTYPSASWASTPLSPQRNQQKTVCRVGRPLEGLSSHGKPALHGAQRSHPKAGTSPVHPGAHFSSRSL